MQTINKIENIEQKRRLVGIDDVELRKAIRRLRVGDFIKLSLMTNRSTVETLLIQIKSIQGSTFQGHLVHEPSPPNLSKLEVGSLLVFTADHIHSIPKVVVSATDLDE
jgi:hypothetical protein